MNRSSSRIFKEGDTVRVEADRSPQGFLSATRIFIDDPPIAEGEKAPQPDDESEADPSQPEDRPTIRTGADTRDYSDPPPREHIPVDSDDPGPPVLRRKTEEEVSRIRRERAAKAAAQPPQPPPAPGEAVETFDVNTGPLPPDPLIEKARARTEAFTDNLPNFICRQLVSRFESQTKPADWMPLDIVEAEVAFEEGMESYHSIKVNGKLLKKQEMSAVGGKGGNVVQGRVRNRLAQHLRAMVPDQFQVPADRHLHQTQEQGLLVSRRAIALELGGPHRFGVVPARSTGAPSGSTRNPRVFSASRCRP